MAIIETFQIDEPKYFYQAFRILYGLLIIHHWKSKEGVVDAISFPFKFLTLFLIKENKKKVANEASRFRLALRLWRIEFGTDLGWHNDPWGMIL